MEPSAPGAGKIRFGLFEVDLSRGELCKRGRKVVLQELPFQVLGLLLDHPGEVVTREQLKQAVWPSDTFIEFDQGLNKAIQKIRQALGDSADNSRFVETLPRKGYRFIAPLELPGQDEPAGQKPQIGSPEPERGVALHAETGRRFRRERAVWIVALAVATAVIIVFWVRWPARAPARLRKLAFTPQGQFDTPVISPDGQHIAYIITDPSEQTGRPTGAPVAGRLLIQDLDREAPREIDGTNGADSPFWSPDSEFVGFSARTRLWKVPARSGSPVPICELSDEFLGGSWSPDGNAMVFSINHQGIYEVSASGGSSQDADRSGSFRL
jgi:DNA-binding winged helix-turn-helix (wHTH) protein